MSYSAIVDHLRRSVRAGKVKSMEARSALLDQLHNLVTENGDELCLAVQQDLRRNKYETYAYELQSVLNEIETAKSALRSWMEPKKVRKTMNQLMDVAEIAKDPLGVVLVIGPWNYPVILALQPLAGALAAGNCVVVKPSEVSVNTANLLAKLIAKYMDQDVVRCINGGVAETTELLKTRFDHIFYTGSTAVGKIVMEAASKHLTPVTLELGGKSPVIVDDTADIPIVARRICWGKFLNSGQTCVAPDYILCIENVKAPLIQELSKVTKEFFGEDPRKHNDYARMVTERHFDRVSKLIEKSGKIAFGGDVDRSDCYISPTILTDVSGDDPVMQDEIFGPVLPIIGIRSISEAINFVNDREKPLALYIFSNDNDAVDNIVSNTSSGGVTVNDCILHMALDTLPFGGVGHSGMGRYHGKFTFDTFSHEKAVLKRSFKGEKMLWMRYPPLDATKFKWAQWITKKRRLPDMKYFHYFMVLLFGALIGYIFRAFY